VEQFYIWHGEESVASWSLVDGYRPTYGTNNAMFDGLYGSNNMYHSEKCDGQDYGGVIIEFKNYVKFVDIVIHTTPSCCRDSYSNVCLYADGENIGCTPDGLADPGNTIHFKDYVINRVVAKEFRLNWENDKCALIEELFFHYGT